MAPSNPFGLHTVTPYLIVPSVHELVDFLKQVFGATIRGELQLRDDRSVQHAEVALGDSVIMMGEPTAEFPAAPAMLYTYVDDCDATYQRALALGATSVLEPVDYPHGDRCGGVKDAAGNIWWVVTHQGS